MELTDELVDVFEQRVGMLPSQVKADFLEATNSQSLLKDLDWLENSLSTVERVDALPQSSPLQKDYSDSAHRYGYERAASLRRDLSFPPTSPIGDLQEFLREHCGWAADGVKSVDGTTNVAALVGLDPRGNPVVVGPKLGHWAVSIPSCAGCVLRAQEPTKSCSSIGNEGIYLGSTGLVAFAAELLAPAEAIRSEVGRSVSLDDMEKLAHKFNVSPVVIEHQLANHRIAVSEAD